jgi:hypothetical protein
MCLRSSPNAQNKYFLGKIGRVELEISFYEFLLHWAY